MNHFIELINRHRSIRKYTDEPVDQSHIQAAVEAGQAASTSSAVQAYCVIQVTDDRHRRRLAELTGPQEKVAESGAFFVVCGDTRRHRLVCESAGRPYAARLEAFLLAVIDATLFAQNFVLALESQGYGICYIGGLRNNLPEVDRLLELPTGVYPLYGLCVGVPAERPAARPRLPQEAVLFEGHYPDDDRLLTLIDRYDEVYRQYLQDRGATPRSWSVAMSETFSQARRSGLGDFYAGKGADLS